MGDDSTTLTSRIYALLSGDPALDQTTREALALVDPSFGGSADPEAVLAAIETGAPRCVLFDAANPAVDATGFKRQLEDRVREGALLLVTILPEDLDPAALGAESEIEHYLSRPFRPETLTGLIRLLLDRAGATGASEAQASPALQVRRPGRFSARPLYGEATAFVRESFQRAVEAEAPDMDRAAVVAEKLHTSLLQSNLLLLRALEPYKRFELPTHCANVAIFAGKIAMGLDLPLLTTQQTIQAGLVHDLGMMRLPERILDKAGPLTEDERHEMQEHPSHGAEILHSLGADYEWLVRAVLQEHERIHGQGYPAALEGEAIDRIAQIVGVADVFEAYSHARSYRSPFTSYEALEKVIAMRDEYFSREIVDALADEISVFPLDSYVLLSTGEIARVVATNPDNLMRPTIEVLWDGSWQALSEPQRRDLGAIQDVTIERPLHESEVPIT